MKIVIDTNVVIAGLYSQRGASFLVLDAAVSGKLEYALSPLIALEYIGKIEEKIREGMLSSPREDYLRIVELLVQHSEQIMRPVTNRPTLPDPGDDKVLECALTAHCDRILTFNIKDFPARILRRFGITAIPPGEFIRSGGVKR